MASSGQFDIYEYSGVIAPGAILLIGIGETFPQIKNLLGRGDINLGELGIFVIVAFVAGHFVQAVGVAIEFVFWRVLTLPTDRVGESKRKLLSPDQETKLLARAVVTAANAGKGDQWYSTVREIYARLQAANRTQRVDAFNRTYGLFRGLVVCFLILAGLVFWQIPTGTVLGIGLIILALFALQQMYAFGMDYGRELFVQYLALPP